MTNWNKRKIAIGVLLVVTAAATIVAGIFLPPAAPVVAVTGVAICSAIAGEVIKMALGSWLGPCFSPCPEYVYSNKNDTPDVPQTPPNTPVSEYHDCEPFTEDFGSSTTFTYRYTKKLEDELVSAAGEQERHARSYSYEVSLADKVNSHLTIN